MKQHIHLAPEVSRAVWTPDEAITVAKASFTDAKLAFGEAQAELGHMTTRLFARVLVDRQRLVSLRAQTHAAVNKLLAVEEALTKAIEAIERTAG